MKTYSIGIDPDCHTLPFAVLSAENGKAKIEGIWTMKVKGDQKEAAVSALVARMTDTSWIEDVRGYRYKQAAFCTIESQNVSYTGKTNGARPQDLIYLAQVAGACLAVMDGGKLVQPSEWKKTMPKKIVQARCMAALGLKYSLKGGKLQYAVPENFKQFDRTGNLNAGDWLDAGDSVAIAYWRLKKEGVVK